MVLETQGPISKKSLVLKELPIPEPGPGEVLIKVAACGVCHTDLHTVEGDIEPPALPVVPGHQAVGTVAGRGVGREAGRGAGRKAEREAGRGAGRGASTARFKEGDRVGIAWVRSACGACARCKSGRENLCESITFNGFSADGGYAEYMCAPEEFVYALPPAFSNRSAAPLLCAGIIGYRSLRLAELEGGSSLGLFGFGASAHIALQIAVYRGCRVYVFSRSAEHRALAESLGASWTGGADDRCPELLGSAVTFAPVGWMVEKALSHLDRGGTLAINAIHMTPVPELPYELLYHERTVRSVTNSTRKDAVEFLELAAEIPVTVSTQAFQLEEANEALGAMKAGTINGAAVLVL
jgi:propanol-preferring alcohol dehydrogenase